MNRILRILCGAACAFVFCFLAIGYAAVQDELLVTGSVSVIPPNKVFAVYGMEYDYAGNEIGMALNFYNRSKPSVGGEIELTSADGQQYYGKQIVTEIYEGFDTAIYTENTQLPWHQKDIVTVTVVDEGIAPVSTAYWFYNGKYLLKSINDIGKLDTSNVTSMREMFRNCNKLISLDVSGLETGNVTNMSGMFRNCNQMTELIFGDFDTSKVTTMSQMFLSCQKLPTLNLSSFDTSSLRYISQLFNSCNQLTTVYVSDKWNTTRITGDQQMFPDHLVGGAGTRSTSTDAYYARIDGGTSAPGYFTYYKYSLVFEGNNNKASNLPALMLSPTDNTFTLPDAPSHPWATFLGWATTPTVDENITLYQPGSTFTSSSTAPCCDVLYAIWDLGVIEQTDFATAVEQANGNNVIIGGGDWVFEDWIEFNPDKSKRLNLTIWDGNFAGWLMYITNADIVINGGDFPSLDCFYMNDGATVTINGGDWSNITSFTFTEVPDAKVTGGTFGFNPSAYVPAGYIAVDNGNGTWSVVRNANVAFVNEEKIPACSCETKCIELSSVCEVCKTDFTLCKGTEAPAGEELTCSCETKCSELTEACEVCKTDIINCEGAEAPQPLESTEPSPIPVSYLLTDLSHTATDYEASPDEDYFVVFGYADGFVLPEFITVTIDEAEYLVYTDGLEHRDGDDLPPMPVFEPAEAKLTIPAILLTAETKSIEIEAKAISVTNPTELDSPAGNPPSNEEQGEQFNEDTETTTLSEATAQQDAADGEETTAPVDVADPAILPSEDEEDGEETEQPQDTENDQQGQG